MFRSSIRIAAAILAATSATALAMPQGAPTRAVAYADLDLSSGAGRARLEQRIDAAVRTVCGRPAPVDLRGWHEMRLCRSETLASAANQRVGQVIVTASLAGSLAGTAR